MTRVAIKNINTKHNKLSKEVRDSASSKNAEGNYRNSVSKPSWNTLKVFIFIKWYLTIKLQTSITFYGKNTHTYKRVARMLFENHMIFKKNVFLRKLKGKIKKKAFTSLLKFLQPKRRIFLFRKFRTTNLKKTTTKVT